MVSRAIKKCSGGDGRIRTADRGFADPRLNHLATSPDTGLWCRGGDSNSYSLAATAPSTLRVYQFHHLGLVLRQRAPKMSASRAVGCPVRQL